MLVVLKLLLSFFTKSGSVSWLEAELEVGVYIFLMILPVFDVDVQFFFMQDQTKLQ